MLHPAQDAGQFTESRRLNGQFQRRFARQSDKAVEFVDCAVRLDAQVVFRQSLTTGQAGFAPVAAARVDPVDREPGFIKGRLVESFFTHSASALIIWPAPDSI